MFDVQQGRVVLVPRSAAARAARNLQVTFTTHASHVTSLYGACARLGVPALCVLCNTRWNDAETLRGPLRESEGHPRSSAIKNALNTKRSF